MKLALQWAIRDLRGGLHGLRLLFVCLFVGVAAIAGVGSLSSAIVAGLADRGQSILGGDIELRLTQRTATPAELSTFEALGTVSQTARLRAMARNSSGTAAQLSELKAVDGKYPLYGQFRLAGGKELALALQTQTGRPSAVIDPLLAQRLKLKLGDALKIGDGLFQVNGFIQEEPDRATQGFTLGPTVLIALKDLPATGLVQPGSLIRYHYRIKLPEQLAPDAAIRNLNENFPTAGWQAQDRTNSAPGIRRFIEQLGQFLTLVGLSALLVAGVGVGNGVATYLARKTTSIATLKSLGASSGLIFQVYLFEVGLVALGAVAGGLALGAITPFVAAQFLADKLPVPPLTGLYFQPLVFAALQGGLIALIFALWPLSRARSIPAAWLFRAMVEQKRFPSWDILLAILASLGLVITIAVLGAAQKSLALGFIGSAAAVLIALRALGAVIVWIAARLPKPQHPILRVALSNLHRPGAATAQIIMALGLGLSLFAILAMVQSNLSAQIAKTLPERAPSFFLLDIAPDQVGEFRRKIEDMTGKDTVITVPSLRGPIVAVKGIPTERIKPDPSAAWVLRGDRGLTYTAEFPKGNSLVAGKWWSADYQGPPLVSIDADIAKGLGVGVGDTMTVSVLGVDIVATIANTRSVNWDSLGFNFALLFAPGTLENAPHTFMATIEANANTEQKVFQLVADQYPTVSIIRMKEALGEVGRLLGQIGAAVRAMASITIIAGVLVLIGAIASSRQAKTYDSVLLKMLGATRGQILASMALEYALLGIVTAGLALIIGFQAGRYIVTDVLNLEWLFSPAPLLTTVVVGAVMTLLLGLAGIWSILSVRPNQILRQN